MPTHEWTQRSVDAPAGDLFSAPEVCKLLNFGADTLKRLIDEGEFPEGLKLTAGYVVWEWRAIAYYRLRVEMSPRLPPRFVGAQPAGGGKSSAGGGKSSASE